MLLKLLRNESKGPATTGTLCVDGIFKCFTLEDVVRADGVKVYGETAIPAGQYRIVVDMSNRFKRLMPRLVDVPMFDGVRIHQGNTHHDTHGCILVGTRMVMPTQKAPTPTITGSRMAYDNLFPVISNAFDKGEEIIIDIRAYAPETQGAGA